jgi:hypothetical protein
MQRVTVKTSTIFIAKGKRTRVYHSVQDVPQGLRNELEKSTNGFNSATILIADRRGRQELVRALQGMPSGLRTRLASSMQPRIPEAALPTRAQIALQFVKRNWLEILLPGAVGAVIWFAFNYR